MLKACELYSHGDLILDEEDITRFNMKKTDVIGIVQLIQEHANLIALKNGEVSILDKDKYIESLMHSKGVIWYISRGKSLILPHVQIHYAILDNEKILAIYNDEHIRDAKLSNAITTNKINLIIEDISTSHQFLKNYNDQKKLRKVYDRLGGYDIKH